MLRPSALCIVAPSQLNIATFATQGGAQKVSAWLETDDKGTALRLNRVDFMDKLAGQLERLQQHHLLG